MIKKFCHGLWLNMIVIQPQNMEDPTCTNTLYIIFIIWIWLGNDLNDNDDHVCPRMLMRKCSRAMLMLRCKIEWRLLQFNQEYADADTVFV